MSFSVCSTPSAASRSNGSMQAWKSGIAIPAIDDSLNRGSSSWRAVLQAMRHKATETRIESDESSALKSGAYCMSVYGKTKRNPMDLMGVDVGFSITRPTTGIACLQGDQLFLERAGTTWESRLSAIPRGFQPSVIALDGPLLPQGAKKLIRRNCESLFIRSPFHNRCKPGLSHWGTGLELRRAAAEASAQFGRILAGFTCETDELSVFRGGPIVEAFPNALLGVLMPEEELTSAPKLRRGRRFDWLYEQVVTTGRLESLLSKSLQLPDEVWRRLGSERDHELRAALICLLTAGLAAAGTAAIIGELTGGWFWLPPWSIWEPWAKQGFNSVAKTMALKGQVLDNSPSY